MIRNSGTDVSLIPGSRPSSSLSFLDRAAVNSGAVTIVDVRYAEARTKMSPVIDQPSIVFAAEDESSPDALRVSLVPAFLRTDSENLLADQGTGLTKCSPVTPRRRSLVDQRAAGGSTRLHTNRKREQHDCRANGYEDAEVETAEIHSCRGIDGGSFWVIPIIWNDSGRGGSQL